MKAYDLNHALYDLHDADRRAAFQTDEAAYLAGYDLGSGERQAIRERDWKRLHELGASIYVLTKLGATVGVNLFQMGAHMRGQSFDDYQRFARDQEERAAAYALLPPPGLGGGA